MICTKIEDGRPIIYLINPPNSSTMSSINGPNVMSIMNVIMKYANTSECIEDIKKSGSQVNVSIQGDLLVLNIYGHAYLEYLISSSGDSVTLHAKTLNSLYDSTGHEYTYDALEGVPLFFNTTVRKSTNFSELARRLWLNALPHSRSKY